MNKDDITSILNATMRLPDSSRIALGRMFGTNLRSAMTSTRGRNAVITFMTLFDSKVYEKLSIYEKNILFFSTCAMCAQDRRDEDDKPLSQPACAICAQDRNDATNLVEKYLSSVYNDANTSDSEKNRIKALIAENITVNGNFLKHLSAYVKRGQRDGNRFNIYTLASDLMFWNHVNGWSREKWAMAIVRGNADDSKKNNDEENEL